MRGVALSATSSRWRDVAAAGRVRLTVGLVLVELVYGLQSLVVTTAMPQVLRDLGGVGEYGLVFSGYMLAGLVSIPLSGRDADRRGPAQPFLSAVGVFAVGTVLAGVAPSMLLLAGARVVQGYGGGALYALAYGVISDVYPAAVRPRMMVLLSAVWVVSGLLGPSYGALLATTVGWRWAFLSMVVPLAVAALLVVPALPRSPRRGDVPRLDLRWPLLLTAGTAGFVGALAAAAWWSAPVAVVSVTALTPALRHVLPAGALRVRQGAPAAAATSFFLGTAYFAADSFLPLLLTGVRHRTVAEAGVAVTIANASNASLRAGLAGVFGLALLSLAVGVLAARRL